MGLWRLPNFKLVFSFVVKVISVTYKFKWPFKKYMQWMQVFYFLGDNIKQQTPRKKGTLALVIL